jgi:hypothetical protein
MNWIAPIVIAALALAAGFEPAKAEDRATLDRCEAQLTACYKACKASEKKPSDLCNVQCSTVLCGLAWRESFGAFLDRRVEETAKTNLPGLMLKKDRQEIASE